MSTNAIRSSLTGRAYHELAQRAWLVDANKASRNVTRGAVLVTKRGHGQEIVLVYLAPKQGTRLLTSQAYQPNGSDLPMILHGHGRSATQKDLHRTFVLEPAKRPRDVEKLVACEFITHTGERKKFENRQPVLVLPPGTRVMKPWNVPGNPESDDPGDGSELTVQHYRGIYPDGYFFVHWDGAKYEVVPIIPGSVVYQIPYLQETRLPKILGDDELPGLED